MNRFNEVFFGLKKLPLLFCALLLLALNSSGQENDQADVFLYITSDGNDNNPGTKEKPFASLEKAKMAVRYLMVKRPGVDITVYLMGGTYPLREPVVFGLEDSGGGNQSVTYAPFPGESAILSGGTPIGNWEKLKKHPKALPEESRGHIWVADLPDKTGEALRFNTLYDENGLLPRARSKGFQPTTIIKKPPFAYRYYDRDVLHFPEGALKEWKNLEDIEILIRPTHAWVVNYLQLKSVDVSSLTAHTVQKGSYTLARIHNMPDEHSCWVENVLEALDEPGEWVLNSREKKIYLWPREEAPGDRIVAASLSELIRVEGEINEYGPADKPVKNINFKNLTFSHSDRQVTGEPGGTMLVFRGAENCRVEGCRFEHSGGNALLLEKHCQHIDIRSNHIHHLGGQAISITGYGPGTKDVNKKNRIINNHIHHCGLLAWKAGGIRIYQSGENIVRNNRIHDLNYGAIWVSGVGPRNFGINDSTKWKGYYLPKNTSIRWEEVGEVKTKWDVQPFLHSRYNLIEDNEIHDIMKILGDGNGISISGSGPGNVIRRNLIYHTNGWWAIRTDDDQFNTMMRDNIIIGNGFKLKHKNNFIQNNIFIHGGKACVVLLTNSPDCRVYRNIFVDSYHRESEVKFSDTYNEPDSRVFVDYNLYWDLEGNSMMTFMKEMQQEGSDKHSEYGDPLFSDLEHADFRLSKESPALQLGFQPIAFEKIGLLDAPAFERLKDEGFVVKNPEIHRGSFPGK